MIRRTHRVLLIVGLTLLMAALVASPAVAAAPRLMMVYGPPLSKPIVLQDWRENLTVMVGLERTNIDPGELEGRPYLKMALFWGPRWVEYVEEGRPLDALRPEQANQHARFYPATEDEPALITFGSSKFGPGVIRRVEPEALAVLARHGIPVRSEAPPSRPDRSPDTGSSIIDAGSVTVGVVAVVIVATAVGAYAILKLRSGSSRGSCW
jgi:hypothetical protein